MKKILFLSATLLLFSSTACKKLFPFKKTVIKIRDTLIFKDISLTFNNIPYQIVDDKNFVLLNTDYKVNFKLKTEGKKPLNENYFLNIEDITPIPTPTKKNSEGKEEEEKGTILLNKESIRISPGNYPHLSDEFFLFKGEEKGNRTLKLTIFYTEKGIKKELYTKEFDIRIIVPGHNGIEITQQEKILLSQGTSANFSSKNFTSFNIRDVINNSLYDIKIDIENVGTAAVKEFYFSLPDKISKWNDKKIKWNEWNNLSIKNGVITHLNLNTINKETFQRSIGGYRLTYHFKRLADGKVFSSEVKNLEIINDNLNFQLKNTFVNYKGVGTYQTIIISFPEGTRGENYITNISLSGKKGKIYNISSPISSAGIDSFSQPYYQYVRGNYDDKSIKPTTTIDGNPNIGLLGQSKNGNTVGLLFVRLLEEGTATLSVEITNKTENIKLTKTIEISALPEKVTATITPIYPPNRKIFYLGGTVPDPDKYKFNISIKRELSPKDLGLASLDYEYNIDNLAAKSSFKISSNNQTLTSDYNANVYQSNPHNITFHLKDKTSNITRSYNVLVNAQNNFRNNVIYDIKKLYNDQKMLSPRECWILEYKISPILIAITSMGESERLRLFVDNNLNQIIKNNGTYTINTNSSRIKVKITDELGRVIVEKNQSTQYSSNKRQYGSRCDEAERGGGGRFDRDS